jgi:hypothetical protein
VAGAADKLIAQYPHNSAVRSTYDTHEQSLPGDLGEEMHAHCSI